MKHASHQDAILSPVTRIYSSQVIPAGDLELMGPQTAKETKYQGNPKIGLAHRPKPKTRDIKNLHIDMADELCEWTLKEGEELGKVGLSILEEYRKRRENIFTSHGPKDATLFHATLDQMQELAKNEGRR